MRQATHNMTVIQGDTWAGKSFTITVNGVAINLSGARIVMQVVTINPEGTVVLDLNSDVSGGITITGANTFDIDERLMNDVAADQYKYDIQITFVDTTVKTYIKGKFTVVEEVSE